MPKLKAKAPASPTPRQRRASRKNGRKGGRPRLSPNVAQLRAAAQYLRHHADHLNVADWLDSL